MLRYLRLYAAFVRFSFSRAMEFRLDFFFRIVMDCVFYAVQLLFFAIIYLHTDALGGWSEDQIIIFVSGFFLIDAINMTVFSNNMWWLPIFVNKGELDYYLVRPVSTLFVVSLRDFAANSFLNLVIASGILIWALARYPEPLGALEVTTYVGLIILGSVLYWMIHLMFLIPVFWLHTDGGLRGLFFEVEKLSERPDQIYGPWLRRTLLSLLPLALVASYPAHLLFEGFTIGRLAYALLVTAATFGVTLLFWRAGLRSYASASS